MAKKVQTFEFSSTLLRLIDSRMRANLIDGVVTAVDTVKYTCTVKVEKTIGKYVEFTEVILGVLIDAQASFVRIPKLQTPCHISFLDLNTGRPTLVDCHECEKLMFKVGDQSLVIQNGNFLFNDGTLGGLVNVNKLVTEYNKIAADMQIIKLALATPCAAGVPLNPAFIPQTTNTTAASFENPKIKQ